MWCSLLVHSWARVLRGCISISQLPSNVWGYTASDGPLLWACFADFSPDWLLSRLRQIFGSVGVGQIFGSWELGSLHQIGMSSGWIGVGLTDCSTGNDHPQQPLRPSSPIGSAQAAQLARLKRQPRPVPTALLQFTTLQSQDGPARTCGKGKPESHTASCQGQLHGTR